MHLVYHCLQVLAPEVRQSWSLPRNLLGRFFLDKSGHEMTILISLEKSRRNASRVGPREITGAEELQMFFL